MPLPNFHAARIIDPDDFIKDTFVTKPLENGNINLILGKLKTDGDDGSLKIQAIRFKKSKYTVKEAKKWLSEHSYKPILFEASEEKSFNEDEKFVKTFPFMVTETKELNTDKGHYGIIKGYASTYGDIDRCGDIVLSKAFSKSLEKYKENGRPIRMQFQHSKMDIIGGFPANKVHEDEKGLFVEGEINLDVQRGKEIYALAKQGVLTDMSICYTINDYSYGKEGEKLLKDLNLWEISVVGEPANENANILSVKSISLFDEFKIANIDTIWDKQSAIKRIKEFTRSDDEPSNNYANAFMVYDQENTKSFDAYKLPYVDIIDNKLKVIPKAIFANAAILKSARNSLELSSENKFKAITLINKYYEKMGLDTPLKEFYDNTIVCKDINWVSSKEDVNSLIDDFKINININDIRSTEKNLRDVGFSKRASCLLINVYKKELGEPVQSLKYNNEVFNDYLCQVLVQVKKLRSYLIK